MYRLIKRIWILGFLSIKGCKKGMKGAHAISVFIELEIFFLIFYVKLRNRQIRNKIVPVN